MYCLVTRLWSVFGRYVCSMPSILNQSEMYREDPIEAVWFDPCQPENDERELVFGIGMDAVKQFAIKMMDREVELNPVLCYVDSGRSWNQKGRAIIPRL